jgi:hypothetical protein
VALDNVTLVSRKLGLVGKHDRMIRQGRNIVPEEWKSARQVRPWQEVQMRVYFLLIEQEMGVQPPHGFIVCGGAERHRIENTERLRAKAQRWR